MKAVIWLTFLYNHRENYEDNWDNREAGSAFSVYYKGENVVDLWAGFADLEAKRLWKEDTMTVIFSTTKGKAVSRGAFTS